MDTLDMTLSSYLALMLGGKSLEVKDRGDKIPESLKSMIPDDEAAMEDCARIEMPYIIEPEYIRGVLLNYFEAVGWESYGLRTSPEFMMGSVCIAEAEFQILVFYEKGFSEAGKSILCVNILTTVC